MKKKLLSLALAVCMALTLLPTAAFAAEPAGLWTDGVSADASAAFSGGDGTAGTPYLLSSATDLAQLSVNVKQKANYYSGIYFKLTTDIDLAGKYWVPIGYTTGFSTAFQGNFNGDGHIVDNMTVKRSVIGTGDTYFLGFFGWIYSGASVRNLGLANASITVDEWSGGQDVGLLVGYADNGCAVEDCFAQGAIDASVDVRSIGGLVGQNYSGGSMTNCYFIGNINAAGGTQTGGLVGDRRGATPLNCYVAAAITSSASNKYAVASSATNCYYDSTLNATVTDGQGTAKTTAEMKTADTASLLNNEGSAWAHNAGVNGGYPYLANLVPHGVVPVDTYTYNTPAPVAVNGVTATVTYDPASPQAGGTEITATVTLSGTATAAGTHTVNLSSTQAGLTGTAQNITVSAGQTSFTVPNTYTFTVPTSAVGDLTLTHTASPYILMTNGTQTVTIDADGLTIYDDGGPSGYYSNNCHSTLTIYPASGYDQVSISGNYHIESSTWDYIKIYDGADTDGTGKVLFINYSDSTPGNMPTITSTEGYLTILFHTDSSIAYEGFNLRAVAINSAAPPSCTFSFDGDNAGKLMGATAAMEYSLDGGTSWADCTADMALAVDNITVQNGIKVRINATPDLAQTINITKAETPTTAGKTDCTTAANNDGKLTGVTTAMEYKNSDAALWTDGTGSAITGLANGTYYVRVKATGTVLASENQELIINAYSAPTAFTVTFNPNGGSVDPASAATGADGKLDSLPTPTRSGSYRFDGWYTAASGGTQITTEYVFDSDTTIYAHWTYTGGGGGGTSYSYYTITATAGDGGSISPSGSASVREGSDKTYTVTPNTGYVISDVLVDGKSAGIVETYTFEDVRKEHTIAATFVEKGLDTGAWANPFSDVTESDWFYEDVARINILDLMKGTSDTTFSPYTDTTRGMIVTILYRLENEPDTAADTLFDDVENGKYYADAVAWAADNNIVEGYGNGLFGPEDNITREQMAAILYRYAQYKGYDVSVGEDTNILSYNDVAEVSEWAIPAMQWACGAGIIRGDAGNLMPKDGATRAQAAAMLVRFIGNVVK